MKVKVEETIKTVVVEELQAGDEFWGDKPFKHEAKGYQDDDPIGDFIYYTIIDEPIDSINTNLFNGDGRCIVVPCEYADGGRGSRLFDPGTTITIRRKERIDAEAS